MNSKDPLNDGISSIELLDSMGTDLTVVNAARVSMAKESYRMNKKDEGLIKYLARHNHWTPFSQVTLQFRIKMPIFVARQWFKHQIGITRNEVSRRYVSDTPEFFLPKEWRLRADNVKQGSSDAISEHSGLISMTAEAVFEEIGLMYADLIETMGVCPEQARMILPQSMYTEFVETGSLAAYARLCQLRLDPHAQKEIRVYAEALSQLIPETLRHSWSALNAKATSPAEERPAA